jgi:hypothetical protein
LFQIRHQAVENINHNKANTMRCPKCGYISFDHQEICRKCNKNIGDIVTEVNGTVCDALAPSFLQLDAKDRFSTQTFRPKFTEENAIVADSGPDLPIRDGVDIDLFQGDKEIAFADESEELVMDFDDFKEVSLQEEDTLDLDEDHSGVEKNLPPLDFGDLDISDLAPPDKEGGTQEFEEELKLVGKDPVAGLSENLPQQQKIPATKATGLEDLQVNGLNLDSTANFVSGSAADKRCFPSVKTGTALDKFDVDLGELFAQNKK